MKELKTYLQEDGTFRHSIMAPDFVTDREERPHYEKDRFSSMEANLKYGDVLFDVGTELGWQSAIYAKFVGPENMCLFEPHEELWPTIEHTWALNLYALPKAAVCSFVSNRRVGQPSVCAWPKLGVPLQNFDTWAEIHSRTDIPEITLDGFVEDTGIVPRALTIDVEGSEMRVVEGMEETLRDHQPLVWMSIHPEKRLESFRTTKQQILFMFRWYGYECQYLGVDHEEHYFFYPRKSEVTLVDSPWKTYGKRDMTFEEAIPGWTDSMGMPYAKEWGRL